MFDQQLLSQVAALFCCLFAYLIVCLFVLSGRRLHLEFDNKETYVSCFSFLFFVWWGWGGGGEGGGGGVEMG